MSRTFRRLNDVYKLKEIVKKVNNYQPICQKSINDFKKNELNFLINHYIKFDTFFRENYKIKFVWTCGCYLCMKNSQDKFERNYKKNKLKLKISKIELLEYLKKRNDLFLENEEFCD